MPAASMQSILRDAFAHRYGVGAFHVVDGLTMEAVLSAASETRSPVIVQVSVKTMKQMGARLLRLMFEELASRVTSPPALHLDHCPDRALIAACIEAGWDSVLFDASAVSYEDNLAQTREVVAPAHEHGVAVEGELESIRGVEDGMGSEAESPVVPLKSALRFLRETGIDSFAAAIGTAHGLCKGEPWIGCEHVSEIVAAEPIPLVVHGGTGLRDEAPRELIARGAVKVNISTRLKLTMADAYRAYLNERPSEHDPLEPFAAVRGEARAMAAAYLHRLGSAGRAS